jgi:hypothetical protein
LLYLAGNWIKVGVNSSWIKYHPFHHLNHQSLMPSQSYLLQSRHPLFREEREGCSIFEWGSQNLISQEFWKRPRSFSHLFLLVALFSQRLSLLRSVDPLFAGFIRVTCSSISPPPDWSCQMIQVQIASGFPMSQEILSESWNKPSQIYVNSIKW